MAAIGISGPFVSTDLTYACSVLASMHGRFFEQTSMGGLLFHAHHRYIIHQPATRPTSTRSEIVQLIIEEQSRNICSIPLYVLSEINKAERGRPRCIRFSASGSFFSNQMLSKLGSSLKNFMLHSTLHSLECLRLDLQFVLQIDPTEYRAIECAPSNPSSRDSP